MEETMKFHFRGNRDISPEEVLKHVYQALQEKGYDPVHQLVGYLISGDPAYIPRHNQARSIIRKVERDELLEELVRAYLEPSVQEGMENGTESC